MIFAISDFDPVLLVTCGAQGPLGRPRSLYLRNSKIQPSSSHETSVLSKVDEMLRRNLDGADIVKGNILDASSLEGKFEDRCNS